MITVLQSAIEIFYSVKVQINNSPNQYSDFIEIKLIVLEIKFSISTINFCLFT